MESSQQTSENTDSTKPNGNTNGHAEPEVEQEQPEPEEEEEEKFDFDTLYTNDIFYSCVYNQYCRKPGVLKSSSLANVSYFE